MTETTDGAGEVEKLVETPALAEALESRRFKSFLDHLPLALAVSELGERERIVYVNHRFEALAGHAAAALEGRSWDALEGAAIDGPEEAPLADAILGAEDRIPRVRLAAASGGPALAELHVNVIEDDAGAPKYRLVALTAAHADEDARAALEDRLRQNDTLLRELQHRVKNNLQMITALIRLEARSIDGADEAPFQRLAGRVAALALLYDTLAPDSRSDEVDLGLYLTQIATAVMSSHATEGIRLDLRVDAFPVSVNVAMPAGLVVNELLTNALKHAFHGRDGGKITLHSTVEGDGCTVVVADDGIGLPEGETWPTQGRLGALIARSLEENAGARLEVRSAPDEGVVVSIRFSRAGAAPVTPA